MWPSPSAKAAPSPPAAPARVLPGQVTLRPVPRAPEQAGGTDKGGSINTPRARLPVPGAASCFNCSPFWAKYLPKVGKKAPFQGLTLKLGSNLKTWGF